MRAWKGELGSSLKGVLPKWHGSFQVRLTPSVIPSEVEESLILTITSSKRCLDCARHDKKPIWATGPLLLAISTALLVSGCASSRCFTEPGYAVENDVHRSGFREAIPL